MGKLGTRSAFAAALCTGVAMVGTSVHGLLGVDAELQRSVSAAQRDQIEERTFRVTLPRDGYDCRPASPAGLRERV